MQNSFIEKMAVLYQAVPSVLLVSVRLAQACVESGYGNSELARNANNYAGIKASAPWTGEVYRKDTLEEVNGKMITAKEESFRKYKTIEDFVKDHSNFITSTEWRKRTYTKVIEATTYQGQCAALTQTYATDSGYGRKLIKLIEEYGLAKYDKEVQNMAITKPKIIDRRKQALGYPGHGAYAKRSLSAIKNIVWHYTATAREGYGADVIKAHESYWRNHHGWDIGGYHFYIDRQGNVFQNYDLTIVTYGAGRANPYSVHISLEASSESNYTNAQIISREKVTLWLMHELKLSASAVRGHREMPGNSTSCPGYSVARLEQFRGQLASVYKNKTVLPSANSRLVDLPDYKAPAKPFDELKVGQAVTIREGMKAWYNPADKEGVKPSKDFTGDKDTIERVMSVDVSYSKRAYLLKGKRSWILEQDIVEARQSWVAIPVKDDGTDKGHVELDKSKDYVFIEGAYYDIVKRK